MSTPLQPQVNGRRPIKAWDRYPSPGLIAPSSAIHPVLLASLCLLVGSIPFETVALGIPMSVSKVLGVLLLIASLIQPHLAFRSIPAALWYMVAYLGVIAAWGMVQGGPDETLLRLLRLVQLAAVCCVFYNLMLHKAVSRAVWLTFCASCAALCLLQLSGLAAGPLDSAKEGRVAALGWNPNELAGVLALGVLPPLVLWRTLPFRRSMTLMIVCGVVGLTVLSVVRTGSRGGAVCLAAGIVVLMQRTGKPSERLKRMLLTALIVGAIGIASFAVESVRQRWQNTIESGNMAKRERIFPAALQMFAEAPIVGWGPTSNTEELGARVPLLGDRSFTDPQNVILWVITETGVLGFIPFAAAVWLWLRAAWRSRHGEHGYLPLAMTATLWVLCMSTSLHNKKMFWIVMAYALASETSSLRSCGRPAERAMREMN